MFFFTLVFPPCVLQLCVYSAMVTPHFACLWYFPHVLCNCVFTLPWWHPILHAFSISPMCHAIVCLLCHGDTPFCMILVFPHVCLQLYVFLYFSMCLVVCVLSGPCLCPWHKPWALCSSKCEWKARSPRCVLHMLLSLNSPSQSIHITFSLVFFVPSPVYRLNTM